MVIEVPGYEYFEARNIFSGSKGDFNFKILPDGEVMRVKTWMGRFCLEKSEVWQEQEFPISKDGFELMRKWLDTVYASI
ncbi:hypothetical protein [Massiliimalia timonensis]|uniref:Uncharacterized protein n=1 Tax=Massiliimalia timonensis TaxID=1987501 RepID=A0A8J6TV04_9FIRM|nr:hypothetical protein [Massiliimalia timonensis]MBC8611068.1 hypothetical protein [Massiliimalia timonensis]MBS7176714.1 hypothetical protein [Clostridiales bacterium]SCI17715.1 Uncharacterised protein [uncultured Clostridium sp.]